MIQDPTKFGLIGSRIREEEYNRTKEEIRWKIKKQKLQEEIVRYR